AAPAQGQGLTALADLDRAGSRPRASPDWRETCVMVTEYVVLLTNPRSRTLIGPTAVSIAPITPSRSHSALTAASPAFGVGAPSGAPTRACPRLHFPPRILATR
ncbi:MAG: hypothetical protein ACLQDY_23870, partial [Streptosporangiaceae bacterium]